ncbi:hypothetical protein [Enterococcus phoeniculicola]|jgi:hypothetical protein|uniref:Uncharacterized protein n=1 Tax=Enterococcus phoeniculicola ATCC BAA-412 TaxID=1158610 RepID=R3TNT2_9ENTE|nr:hypothetical protein [Enterococcus phoeniculicola]EOL43189.1 hypothetical protein UC3_02166 [Enterococcus phoeniculicola ATCC BAA-412]EOT76453.1 hypothetical protein I589_01410 [Enterococcus phoeniculicola ATCC BAA-412]
MKKVKIFSLFVLSIFLIFAVAYNIAFFYFKSQFKPYATKDFSAMQEDLSYYFNDSDNGFLLNVKFPSYGTLTGNLAVATADSKYALIIWPKLSGDTEIGFQTAIKNPSKRKDRYLKVEKGRIDLSNSSFTDEEQKKIISLEKEAKTIWGEEVFQ